MHEKEPQVKIRASEQILSDFSLSMLNVTLMTSKSVVKPYYNNNSTRASGQATTYTTTQPNTGTLVS